MAKEKAKDSKKEKIRGSSYALLHKLVSAVALLMFVVIMVNGFKHSIGINTIIVRSSIALVCVSLVARVVIKVLKTYEEMNSD